MDRPIKFGSVCSGIEAASVAWMPLGWKAAWLAEIEPFPSAVLAHHYPDVPNLGDMTALPERIAAGEVEAPDIFCGGTPCQAFSVAGLRNSLTDERGGLTLKFVEIANAIDAVRVERGEYECIVFWENVPGVLNTKDNAFGCFLAGLAGEDEPLVAPGDKWTNAGCVFGPQRAVAWRVLDAQYFGVAQRRRRVFVVASARTGFDPAAVLFEFDGVRRDTAPSRESGEVAPTIPSRSTAGGGLGTDFDLDGGVITMAHGQGGAEIGFDRGPTLTCNHEAPIAVYADALHPCEFCGYRFDHDKLGRYGCPNCCGEGLDVTHTLRGEGFDASEDGTGRGTPLAPHVVGPLACNTGPNGHDAGNFACNQAVDAGHVLPVAFAENSRGEMRLEGGDGQRTGALSTGGGKPGQGVPMICFPATLSGTQITSAATAIRTANTSANGHGISPELAHTLDRAQGQCVAFDTTQITSAANYSSPKAGDPCHPLAAGAHPPAIAFPANLSGTQCASTEDLAPSMGAANPTAVAVGVTIHGTHPTVQKIASYDEIAQCLRARTPGNMDNSSTSVVMQAMQVRRLTPVECEKLQGFPDSYTMIPWRNKPADLCPDGPRYRALGNSWAVPVVSWIGRRIQHEIAT